MERFQPRGRPQGNPPVEKPYAFVPLPQGAARRQPPIGHHQYRDNLLTGTLEGIITARSPVHVASGQLELTNKQPSLVQAHFRRAGQPTLPGSSLKGAIRSIVEAIARPPACLRVTRARRHQQPQQARACDDKTNLCVACQMFGAMGYLGQIHVHDAVLSTGEMAIITIPSLFAPRDREGLYFIDGQVRGRKFYRHGTLARGSVPIEACTVGAQFRLRVDFTNLSAAQLGLLLIAMGQGTPALHPKLGGAKPACCGSVAIHTTGLHVLSARDAALEYDTVTQALEIAPLTQVITLVNQEALAQLAQILAYPGDTACPGGTY